MPTSVQRNGVRDLVASGAALVEVLPPREYQAEHLEGAISIPLGRLVKEAPHRLERDQAVVVYCHDSRCDLSARAAWRLETLGFHQVFRYSAGKTDWAAAGLPTEGDAVTAPRAGQVARRDVPRADLNDASERLREVIGDADSCAIVNESQVLLGVVDRAAVENGSGRADELMDPAPLTVRPDTALETLAKYLGNGKNRAAVWVTTCDGELIGVVTRAELVQEERTEGRTA
jgi:rhodanese-related sulfurtransferase